MKCYKTDTMTHQEKKILIKRVKYRYEMAQEEMKWKTTTKLWRRVPNRLQFGFLYSQSHILDTKKEENEKKIIKSKTLRTKIIESRTEKCKIEVGKLILLCDSC